LITAIDGAVKIVRATGPASRLLKSPEVRRLLKEINVAALKGKPFLVVGHTRMATHGGLSSTQPVVTDRYVAAHNGIFLSTASENDTKSDTQLFFEELTCDCDLSSTSDIPKGHLRDEGGNSAIWIELGRRTWGYETSNSNLFQVSAPGLLAVGSEPSLVNMFASAESGAERVRSTSILTFESGEFYIREQHNLDLSSRSRLQGTPFSAWDGEIAALSDRAANLVKRAEQRQVRRCESCILPSTFPGLTFSHNGICSMCLGFTHRAPLGEQALKDLLDKRDASSPILVPLSGGRDSSYAVAKLATITQRPLISFTYDWGFVSDLARRNISAICGSLGVENVLVSANIAQRREDVKRNLLAWGSNPSLATIPLMMAGDKAFFLWASRIANERGASPTIFSMNWLEKTDFKVGFASSDTRQGTGEKLHSIAPFAILRLAFAYALELLRNPRLINRTLFRTLLAFSYFYLRRKDYIQLFDYLEWDESDLERTISSHGWRGSVTRNTSWRVGDSTSSFYNLAYMAAVGFTENDTFLSNQIRQGQISREYAASRRLETNEPDVVGIVDYCRAVDINPEWLMLAVERLQAKCLQR
jgi:hypothetical protein